MSTEVFQIIRSEVFPLARTVGISCGAEPLANPNFIHHLQALYESGVPYRQMVTNGTLLTDKLIHSILRFPPTSFFVSIDGTDNETHSFIRDGANLGEILAMVEKLVAGRGSKLFPMIGFSTTLQKANLHQLEDIVKLAARYRAVSVGVVPLVPYEGLNTIDRVVNLNSAEAKEQVDRAEQTAGNLGVEFHLSSEITDRKSAHPCSYLHDTVFIDPHGSVFPCPYWNTEFPLGNVLEGFDKIWRGTEYKRLRNGKFKDTDNCLQCPEVTSRTVEVTKARQ